jgi:MFS family permease
MNSSTVDAQKVSFGQVFTNLKTFLTNKTALAVGLVFAADSCMFGAWVTQIPGIKTRLGLDDGTLGLALFGMPLGLLLMNPVSPWLMQRLGLVSTMVWSTAAMAFTFVLPMWISTLWLLFGVLFLIGASVAVMNVAMNTCATQIEEAQGQRVMSSCHGMWSFGGMIGSAVSAGLIKLGVLPQIHMTVQALLVTIAALLWLRPGLAGLPPAPATDAGAGGSKFAWPTFDLILMILIGLCTSMCEGVAFDWSAVYLRDSLHAPEQVAALGFTFFSLAMMLMRFTGDVLMPRFGERNLLYFTTVASSAGLLVVIMSSYVAVALGGFLLLGVGVALGAPILFNAAARVPGFAAGAGLATYATFSFIGFLIGPPLLGLFGKHYGLANSFMIPMLMTLTATLAVRRLKYLR